VIRFLQLTPGDDATVVKDAIARVVTRGWFILGPELDAFEEEFATACGAPYAAGVGTGTDALAIALRALGIGAGDEVITSPLSAAYSALAIMMAGARPVFADIDADRLTLDPRAAAAAVTSRTAAIMPVHLYGQAADMRAIVEVARRHNLAIVEDCCQAHLATCDGRPVGSDGAAAAYSFYPTKNLGALGDGGALTMRDAALLGRAKRLRNGGQTDKYRHDEFGVNSRLDEIQAAILRARLPLLRGWTDRRRGLGRRYRDALSAVETIVVPTSSRYAARCATSCRHTCERPASKRSFTTPFPSRASPRSPPSTRPSARLRRESAARYFRCRSTHRSPTPRSPKSPRRWRAVPDARRVKPA
jgi:dTDP-4-amino-4,6-dideoxygalactose transaminase